MTTLREKLLHLFSKENFEKLEKDIDINRITRTLGISYMMKQTEAKLEDIKAELKMMEISGIIRSYSTSGKGKSRAYWNPIVGKEIPKE